MVLKSCRNIFKICLVELWKNYCELLKSYCELYMCYGKAISCLVETTMKPTYTHSLSPLKQLWNISLFLPIWKSRKPKSKKRYKVVQKLYYVKVATSSSTRLVGVLLFDSLSTFQKLNHCNLTMLKMSWTHLALWISRLL